MTIAETNHQQEIGRRLAQIREASGIKQADLARKITWSPAVLSRIESGERPLSLDELQIIAEGIGTPDALKLSKSLEREWLEIQRPPLDHPDQDLLWEMEILCQELMELRNKPEVRHAFERRLTEYINDIKTIADLLLNREYDVAFIGNRGVGKSTAISKVAELEVFNPDGGAPAPVLESGGGGVTLCDVHLRSGYGYGLIIEPCSDEEIRAHVKDFAERILRGSELESEEDEGNDDEGRGFAQEIDRAVRNLAGLKVRREKGPDGKTIRTDEAKELAAEAISTREFVVDILTRMELHRRDRRDIWYDPSVGKSELAWLKETFEKVNNGRHPEFTLPNRIEIFVPKSFLGTNELSVSFIDTRGIEHTAPRADLERHLDEPHTLTLLCSGYNEAPSVATHLLLKRAKEAGIRRLELNAALLVLPRANEALAITDEAGVHAETIQEGYDLKAEFASMALEPLGLQNLTIGFFNSFGDEPAKLRSLILECLGKIRQSLRMRIEETIASARNLLLNHEKEQVQEVLRSAARMMATWVSQNANVPALTGHVHDSLLSQIQTTWAATVRASVKREGEWRNLSYGHHLGYGARRLAVIALEPLVRNFKSMTDLMEANPDYADAKNLMQQASSVLNSAFEELLRKTQIMGQTAFKDALKLDPLLWQNCQNEWGKGYRERVAGWNKDWFMAEPRRDIEQELWDVVTHEWDAILNRLSSLLETDVPMPVYPHAH